MSAQIPESHIDLLEEPVFVALTTLMPDGQPQSSVVWCDVEGDYVRVNTTRGRQKEKNMSARPMVTILAVDPEDPYRFIEVRGQVEEITSEGGVDHIDKLANEYHSADSFYGGQVPEERRGTEVRVICKIRPTRVVTKG